MARKGATEVIRFYPLLFLVVGLAVLFMRVEDSNAWLLALMFAGFIAEPGMPDTIGVAPDVLMKFMYAAQTLMKSLLPGLFYFFFAVFPTRSPINRKLPWLKWALLVFGACFGWGGVRHGNLEALPFLAAMLGKSAVDLTNTIVGYGAVILGMASLLWNVIGAPRVEDRRRLNVMLWGTLVGVTPAISDRHTLRPGCTPTRLSGWLLLKAHSCFCFRCRLLTPL